MPEEPAKLTDPDYDGTKKADELWKRYVESIAPVAQLEERRTDNSEVAGSNPRQVHQPTDDEIARFMSYVDLLPWGCWFWNGARSRGRGRKWYGTFYFRSKCIRAHIFAHDILAGKEFHKGWHRDHICGFSLCVNPAHLRAVPHTINQNCVWEPKLLKLVRMCSMYELKPWVRY